MEDINKNKEELINLVSHNRYAQKDNGTIKRVRWSKPESNFNEPDERRIPVIFDLFLLFENFQETFLN